MLPYAVISGLSLAASAAALAVVLIQGRRQGRDLERIGEEVARLRREVASVAPEWMPPATDLPGSARPDPSEDVPPAPVLIAVPDLAADTAADASTPRDERHAAVWSLADSGASPEAIARETGQTVGRVELILALREPRGARA